MSEQAPPIVQPFTGEDQDAPYGRRADGSPKAKPGRRPGQASGTGTTRRRKQPDKVDYKTPLIGLAQLPAGILAMVGMRKPVYAADAAAITIHAPPIAGALDDLAHEDPAAAAVLDRVLQVGPYGALLATIAPLVLQVLANHEAIPPGTLGTRTPQDLINSFVPPEVRAQMEAQAAAEAAANVNGGRPVESNPPE
jgi:hypothetical protein